MTDLLVPVSLLTGSALGLFLAFFGVIPPRPERAWRLWLPGIVLFVASGLALGLWSQGDSTGRTVWAIMLIPEVIIIPIIVQGARSRGSERSPNS